MDQFEADNSILVSHAKDYPEISSAPASENARAFQIQRSPTILFNPIWEPEADTSEANDAALGNDLGDVPTNSVYHSSIHTSPLLTELTASPYPTASRDDCVRPVTSSEETFQLTIEDSTEESDDTSQDLSSQQTDDSLDNAQITQIRGHDVARLEVPDQVLRHESSFITDGGDQQFKSQRLASNADDARNLEPDLSQDSTSVHGTAATSLPGPGGSDFSTSRFVLSGKIIHAMGQNRNPMQPRHERGFLPKAQMDLIVTPRSVLQELCSCHITTTTHTLEQMRRCAEGVCRETKICLPNGKTKIRSFRKIFAILVLTEKPWAIFNFMEQVVSDLDLPLVVFDDRDRPGWKELRRRDASGNPSPESLQCSIGWPPTSIINFELYQWTMLAPFFSPGKYDDVKHYVLHDQDILPFVGAPQDEEDESSELGGGFGRVFMVQIHDEHHNFRHPRLQACHFAIKQLYENNRTMFNGEVNILKRFSGSRAHPHIVPLLATYEQFQKYHLMFYKAEGDLLSYWKRISPCPTFDYENVLWIAKQCKGIANALLCLHKHYTLERYDTLRPQEHDEKEDEPDEPPSKTEGTRFIITRTHRKRDSTKPSGTPRHVRSSSPTWPAGFPRISSDPQELRRQSTDEQPSQPLRHKRFKGDPYRQWGRHGDLKPENILFFIEPHTDNTKGTLKIADFGQAQLNSKSRKSKLQAGEVAHSLAYRAPESDLQPKRISQSHDIWSLGCVYLEFITWMLGGAKLLRNFSKRRVSWDIFNQAETDTFFEIVRNEDTQEAEIMVKPAVTKFICELHSRDNCTDYFHDFLDMIENNMLIIEPESGERARMPIEKIQEVLTNAYKRCSRDTAYATDKKPWINKAMNVEPLLRSVKVEMTGPVEKVINKNKLFLRAHQGPTGT